MGRCELRSGWDEVKNVTVLRPGGGVLLRGRRGGDDLYLTIHRDIVCIPSVCKFCGNVNTLFVNRNEMMNECVTKLLFTIGVQWECYKLGISLNFCL